MLIERRAVAPLKAALVVLFALLLVLQVVSLPGQFAHLAAEDPSSAHLRWPLTAVTVFWVLCVQVVVVATWRLLGMVQQDRIFSEAAFGWVNAIIGAVAAAWLVLVGVLLWAGLTADDPALPLLLAVTTVAVTVLGLLMVVMRALLRQATSLRSDLEGVV